MNASLAIALPRGKGVAMTDDPDRDLVRRAQAGDTDAFSELVRRHERVVYNLAFRFMRNETQADDMAQEAFLKAFRLLKGFRAEARFSTWLYRVTSSVCLTEISRRKRRGEVELTPGHLSGPETAVEPAQPTDTHEIIRRCVTRLPERYATIMTLYYLKEVSYEEIAEMMNIPMGTLKTWMHRARRQLRTIVEQEMNTDGS
jgi:RNA polymerase sigma-70 factor (ECF subfamily)